MATGKPDRYWIIIILALVASIAAGGVTIWVRWSPGSPIEISTTPAVKLETIHLDGAVTNPGVYPLASSDTVETLLQAAGGATPSANLSGIRFYVPSAGNAGAQRININSADVWLLKALPGIGDVLAQRIITYREQKGPFRSTSDLLKVQGFGAATYQRIKDLVTVGE